MSKIMLVEDDNNLREIYEARLQAEGYEIVSARDGEEALALAVKERPDLIISDVMMPKISGFDMLDILRSTPETQDTKVIMMTALSQAEDKARADQLGADRYLVKSQVTLEDVAKVAGEVLNGIPQGSSASVEATTPIAMASASVAPSPIAPMPTPISTTQPSVPISSSQVTHSTPPMPNPVAQTPIAPMPTPAPATKTDPVAMPHTSGNGSNSPAPVAAQSTTDEQTVVQSQINNFVATDAPKPPQAESPTSTVAPSSPQEVKPTTAVNPNQDAARMVNDTINKNNQTVPEAPSSRKKVIEPLNDIDAGPTLDDLLVKENADKGVVPPVTGTIFTGDGTIVAPAVAQDTTDTNYLTPPPTPGSTVDPNSIAL